MLKTQNAFTGGGPLYRLQQCFGTAAEQSAAAAATDLSQPPHLHCWSYLAAGFAAAALAYQNLGIAQAEALSDDPSQSMHVQQLNAWLEDHRADLSGVQIQVW